METMFVVGNIASQLGLVGISGFFVKRWMDRVDSKLDTIGSDIKTANGRTGKIEGKLNTQIAICEERNKQ
jgi:hypothetical protein